jgi:hypothetical protein
LNAGLNSPLAILRECVIPSAAALQAERGIWRGSLPICRARQARFYDFNVWTERKRIEKLRYIHRNPVKRGLVAAPEHWRWSSFRWYLCGEVGPVRIIDTDILVVKIRPPAA